MANERRPRRPDEADYHDPTAGFMGAPPAVSALRLRLVLAVFGLLVCGVGAGIALVAGATAFGVFLVVLAVAAAVDLVVVLRRRSRIAAGSG